MTIFILLFLLGVLTGYVIRPMLAWHKHDYEVLFHSRLNIPLELTFTYTRSLTESLNNFSLERSDANVTYKKCNKCGRCTIDLKALGRDTMYDFDVVKNQLDTYIATQKEQEDQELLTKLNERLGLTSEKVPYNPTHGNQATAQ